jgi:Tol biopolymer transport system component
MPNPSTNAPAERVRESCLEWVDVKTGRRTVVHRAKMHFEAPNWSRDGQLFYFNMAGAMWTLPVSGGEPRRLDTGAVNRCNNDHGLSFDGKWLAISSAVGNEGSKIFVLPSAGGEPRLVTPRGPSYWHGWSPDGKTLVYCGVRAGKFDVYAIPFEGGEERQLTHAGETPGAQPQFEDGPEYSADGTKIYWQSRRSGLVKIWRMNPDGSSPEQVTLDSDYVDWFPHPSPDGRWLVFLSYDKSVKGHPSDQDVVLRIMPLAGGTPRVLASLFGGQGTINVPSWSPDSSAVAFVSYVSP